MLESTLPVTETILMTSPLETACVRIGLGFLGNRRKPIISKTTITTIEIIL
jgi:hypothetical protein